MSRVVLDAEIRARGWRIAAVSAAGVEARVSPDAVSGYGHKEPLAILLAGPDGVKACSPDGNPLSRDQVDALAPGLWGRFARETRAGD